MTSTTIIQLRTLPIGTSGPDGWQLRIGPEAGYPSRTLLVVEDPDSVVRQAVAAGATESSPVSNEHGWRLGRIIDPFGHEWEIGAPLGAWPPN
jgi:hypothetical protein